MMSGIGNGMSSSPYARSPDNLSTPRRIPTQNPHYVPSPGATMSSPAGQPAHNNPNITPSFGQGQGPSPEAYIEHAGKIMDSLRQRDFQYPTLFQALLSHGSQEFRPVSGSVDHDYPNVIEKGLLSSKLFTIEHQCPIPAELTEILAQSETGKCHMGLFPSMYRAWMTIGSDLYVWDFRDGSDLSYYDQLKEAILSLALIPVKSNVFKSAIKNLLCLTTPSQIIILGFILSESPSNGLGLSPVKTTLEIVSQPVFTLSSDQLLYHVVVGTESGRIFLGSNNGSVHEICYQARPGWLRGRCWKVDLTTSYLTQYIPKFLSVSPPDSVKDIVVDNKRNIVFTLANSGAIQAFYMGDSGDEFTRIGYLTKETITNSITSISKRSIESDSVKAILSISPIEYGELNLVAVSDNGTRLYFTCMNITPGFTFSPSMKPSTLKLAHVRLPPGYSPWTNTKRPSTAHYGFHCHNIFSLACESAHDVDILWLITPFIYPSSVYSELISIFTVPGSTVEIKEIKQNHLFDENLLEQPDLITQHLSWRREIVVLTSTGTTVFRAAKPYQLLKDLLMEKQGPENTRGHFEMSINKVHSLSNCMLIAIHPFLYSDTNVADWATKALYMFGGGPDVNRSRPKNHHVTFDLPQNDLQTGSGEYRSLNSLIGTPVSNFPNPASPIRSPNATLFSPTSPNLSSPPPLSSTFIRQEPFSPQQSPTYPPSQAPDDSWPYSQRHDAIFTVVGRIVGPIWDKLLIRTGTIEGANQNVIIPNVTGDEVSYALHFISRLHSFMVENAVLYTSIASKTVANQSRIRSPESRRLQNLDFEKSSLLALRNLLSMTLEVFGMWKILCDHQFHIVLQGVDDKLKNVRMRDLVLGGQNSISIIINALINKYLDDNAAVDAISLRLREICPNLFRNEDAIGTKVAEILSKANQTTDPTEKQNLLENSLTLCEQICGHGRIDIRDFCSKYAKLGFPLGAVRLCYATAKAADPQQLATRLVKTSGNPDQHVIAAYSIRCDIYKPVFEGLDAYLTASCRQSPLTGRQSDENLPPERAKAYEEATIQAILSTDDETFHINLYNWLLERKLFDRLLEVKHPFLDGFLQRAADSVTSGKWPRNGVSSNDTMILDLLWRHHEINQNHAAAATILLKLADSTTTGLDFQQRFDYLARANICANAIGKKAPGDILETVEDKLEVAGIQKQILDALTYRANHISSSAEPSTSSDHISGELKILQDAIYRLNSQLFNITHLYTEFAQPFKLHEIKLEIFSASNYCEKDMIESLWADIIEAELSTSSRQSMESQLEVIRRKLVSLGRKYLKSPMYFPLEYLIEHLEAMKPSEKVDEGWVFKTMMEIGVSFSELIQNYEKLWKKVINRQSPSGLAYESQITRVIMSMITNFLDTDVEIRMRRDQMRILIERFKQIIASFIVEFSSKFEPEADILRSELGVIKERLDRI